MRIWDWVYGRVFGGCMTLIEAEWVPDFVIRRGIRYLLQTRLDEERRGTEEERQQRKLKLVERFKTMPIAINTTEANEQHYEVPTAFFDLCLGKWKKYSACLYNTEGDSLQTAEENMMGAITPETHDAMQCRTLLSAGIEDGMSLLDLGCGWGSLTLFLATKYPRSQVTGVSNSKTQREYIMSMANRDGLSNVTVITADINSFETHETYDRILSIEMFEHMKNYKELLKRMARWLRPDGRVFVHYFCHKHALYEFEVSSIDRACSVMTCHQVKGEDDWMAKHFFTGGTMPSLDLLHYFRDDLIVTKSTYINGVTYSQTLEEWLNRMDKARSQIMPLFKETYGKEHHKWFVYWRLFYIACSELFRYRDGEEWGLAHVLLIKPTSNLS